MMMRVYAPMAIDLVLNLILAFIVRGDIDQLKISTKHVFLATVLYRPIGVVAFLLYALYEDRDESTTVDDLLLPD